MKEFNGPITLGNPACLPLGFLQRPSNSLESWDLHQRILSPPILLQTPNGPPPEKPVLTSSSPEGAPARTRNHDERETCPLEKAEEVRRAPSHMKEASSWDASSCLLPCPWTEA